MNLNDRVALLLGRAIIRAEELTVKLEISQAETAALQEQLEQMRTESQPPSGQRQQRRS